MWARPDGFSSNGSGYMLNPVILTKNQAGSSCYEGYAIGLVTANGFPEFHTTITQPFCNQINGIYGIVNYQNWYHIVLTWNNDTLKQYINGVLQQTLTKGFVNAYLSGDSVMVGNSANVQNNRFFLGAIDDLVIYDHMLSYSEVTALYNNTELCPSNGIGEPETGSVHLFPNPNNGEFSLDVSFNGSCELLNSLGQVVFRKQVSAGRNTISSNGLAGGIYLLRLTDEKEKVKHMKVMIRN